MDELLRAKDYLLSEGGQSLNSIFANCFGDWFIGIPFVGYDVVAKCISKLHYRYSKRCKFRPIKCVSMRLAAGLRPNPMGELERSPRALP